MNNIINSEKLKNAKEKLSEYIKRKLWEDTLRDTRCCFPDEETGNCPCDLGAYCSKCQESWVEDVYKQKLIEEYEKEIKSE